jgi:soluble lytic murein transglycosylase
MIRFSIKILALLGVSILGLSTAFAQVAIRGTVVEDDIDHGGAPFQYMLDEEEIGRVQDDWPGYSVILEEWAMTRASNRAKAVEAKISSAPNNEARDALRFLWVEALIPRKFSQAKQQFEQVEKDHPGRSHLLYLLAIEALNRGEDASARVWFDEVERHSYRYPGAQLKLAQLTLKLAPEDARDRLLRLSPDWLSRKQKVERLLLLSEVFTKLKDKNMARFFISWAWREYPGATRTKEIRKRARKLGVPSVMERVWDVVWKKKGRARRKSLARMAKKWRKKKRRMASVVYGYGRLYRKTRERERALSRFDRARKLARLHRLKIQIEIETALAAHQLGESERVLQATETLDRLLSKKCRKDCPPPSLYVPTKVWQARVDAYVKLGDRFKAERYFAELSPWIKGHEAHAELLSRLGVAAYRDGDLDASHDRFQDLFKNYHDQLSRTRLPWGVRALRWLGHLKKVMGHPRRGETYLRAVKRRWPLLVASAESAVGSFLDEDDWREVDSPSPENTPQMREARYFLFIGRRDLVYKALDASFEQGLAGPHAVACLVHTALSLGKSWRARAVLHRYSGLLGAPGTEPRALLGLSFPISFVEELRDAAQKAGIQPELLAALVKHESNFNPDIRSWAGAIGLAQLLPSTARITHERLGLEGPPPTKRNLRDPALNLELGAAYYAHLLRYFKGDETRSLMAYNAGVGRLKRSYDEVLDLPEEIRLDAMSIMPALGYARRIKAARNIYALLYGRGLKYATEHP